MVLRLKLFFPFTLAALGFVGLWGCRTTTTPEIVTNGPEAALVGAQPEVLGVDSEIPFEGAGAPVLAPDANADALILAFLDQNFTEAASRAPASIEIPPYFQIAANEITPLQLPGEEQFTGATARGNVYLRVDYLQPLVGFCESAIVSVQEVEMRGFPVLRRGRTTFKGTSAETVFTIRGQQLEVEGPHETEESDIILPRTLELPDPRRR